MRIRTAIATAALLLALCMGLAACAARSAAPSTAGPGAPFSEALPPAGTTLPAATRAVSDYTFQLPVDILASEGATWDGETLTLQKDGLSWAIVDCLAGDQLCTALELSGTCDGLWLGVSDYGRGTWRWPNAALALPDPPVPPYSFPLPQAQYFSDLGYIFIALVCPDGASADLSLTLKTTPPGQFITLRDPLGAPLKPLLGVNVGPYPGDVGNADLSAQYTALGVNYVRTHDFYGPLDLAELYPDRTSDPTLPESYNFTESDVRWQAIVDCGAEPYFRLGDSYTNPTPPADATERDNMALAAVEIVKHYRDGQWDGFTTPFTYVEIWNEPDGMFWPGHSELEFFQFYDVTARALKAAWPELKVGGAGFTQATSMAPPGKEYLGRFLDYMESNTVPLNFLSWHMYSNIPTEYSTAGQWYRQQLNDHGFSDAESHITEYNTQIEGLTMPEQVELRSGPRGASIMSAAWIALQQPGTAVDQAMFYRGNDMNQDQAAFFGLYKADGQPKKIAEAFALWSRLTAFNEQLELTALKPGGAASSLWALAGRTTEGKRALLVVNPQDSATNYTIAFSDGSYAHNHTLQLREVNETADGTSAAPTSGLGVGIGAYTVQLVTVDE